VYYVDLDAALPVVLERQVGHHDSGNVEQEDFQVNFRYMYWVGQKPKLQKVLKNSPDVWAYSLKPISTAV
jgi:hypothetical protein